MLYRWPRQPAIHPNCTDHADGEQQHEEDWHAARVRRYRNPDRRLTLSRTDGRNGLPLAPATRSSLRPCTPCSASDEFYASSYQSTVSDGAPSQRIWFDLLGREVKRASRGFDGRWVNVATRYDTAGTVRETSAPYFSGETPLFTQLTYDRLGRLLTKRAP
ncbi:MAG: hypothetical protein JNN30_00680, partial [Rhodanobacteraceae bacterium]|nr:hypothetical protein [Rhodanobacteraceae bacterium]